MAVQGFGDRLERRLDQRQDLVAVARDRVLDALHVGAGALFLRLDTGPVLNIGVRERGQQLGLTAHYQATARVLRVVLEVHIRLLVHCPDVQNVPVGAIR